MKFISQFRKKEERKNEFGKLGWIGFWSSYFSIGLSKLDKDGQENT